MPLTTLEYQTPAPRSPEWWPFVRFCLLGPVTGALVGFVETSAAMLCWIWHGEPDFWFRGWRGVEATYEMLMVGGGVIGVLYGIALFLFERLAQRHIRLKVAIPTVLTLAFLVNIAITENQFRARKLDWFLTPETVAIMAGLAVSTAASQSISRSHVNASRNEPENR
jgi:hypothetical protein